MARRRTYRVHGVLGSGGVLTSPVKRSGKAGQMGGVFVEKDEITPYITIMGKATKNDIDGALRNVAWKLQGEVKKSIEKGHADSINIPKRKKLDRRGVTRLNKNFDVSKYKGSGMRSGKKVMNYMKRKTRRFEGDRKNSVKSLKRGIGYAKIMGGGGYVIGFLSRNAATWGSLVQGGRRGSGPGNMPFHQIQRVTKKQRAFFAALGLNPKKRTLRQKKANFFGPMMHGRSRWIERNFYVRLSRNVKRTAIEAKIRAITKERRLVS